MKATNHRYQPLSAFPSYIFVPGRNPHPKKEGGHMEGLGEPMASRIDDPSKNELLRFALDLYNFGYFWESHVYFEALWNAHQRSGSVADFLKGLIKLGAAGVKNQISQEKLAIEHIQRAKELFSSVRMDEGDHFLGFDLKQLVEMNHEKNPRIDPLWN
jgi:hypothetical protein